MSAGIDRRLLLQAYRRFGPNAAKVGRAAEQIRALDASLFRAQLGVVTDESRDQAVLTPRRAGKTSLVPRYALRVALKRRGLVRYWGISRQRSKELMWDRLKRVARVNDICSDDDFSEAELIVKVPGGGEIRLRGADKEKETHKKRGDGPVLDIIDEAQLFGSFLEPFVEDVIRPGLSDNRGTVCLMGTPGVVCSGYWYRVSGMDPDPDKRELGWNLHRWTAKENTFVPHLWREFLDLKRRKGWSDDHPTWLREYCGQWVNDASALYYAFVPGVTEYSADTVKPYGPGWSHSLGWDLGKMALHCWGWHPKKRVLYETFSWKKHGASTDEVVAEVRRREKQLGLNIVHRVGDPGGLGGLVLEEVAKRLGMRFEHAKKTEKRAHAELFNEDLTAGHVKLLAGSETAEEMAVLPKDPDDPTQEHPQFENHCCDSALYSWRRCMHWLHEPEEEKPAPGTVEAHEAEARRLEREEAEEVEHAESAAWWEFR